jgi:hypothetical protein
MLTIIKYVFLQKVLNECYCTSFNVLSAALKIIPY